MKILFISLGCDKNLVDTEKMLGLLGAKGYTFTDDETEADIIVLAALPTVHTKVPIRVIADALQPKYISLKPVHKQLVITTVKMFVPQVPTLIHQHLQTVI